MDGRTLLKASSWEDRSSIPHWIKENQRGSISFWEIPKAVFRKKVKYLGVMLDNAMSLNM